MIAVQLDLFVPHQPLVGVCIKLDRLIDRERLLAATSAASLLPEDRTQRRLTVPPFGRIVAMSPAATMPDGNNAPRQWGHLVGINPTYAVCPAADGRAFKIWRQATERSLQWQPN